MRSRERKSLTPAACISAALLAIVALSATADEAAKSPKAPPRQPADYIPGEVLREDGSVVLQGMATPKYAVVDRFFSMAWIASRRDDPGFYDFFLDHLGIADNPAAVEVFNRAVLEFAEIESEEESPELRRWKTARVGVVYATFLQQLDAVEPGLAGKAEAWVEQDFRSGGSFLIVNAEEGRTEVRELSRIFQTEIESRLPQGKVLNLHMEEPK